MRTELVAVPGAGIPLPYGGKERQIMLDVDPARLQAHGLSPQDISDALAAQNLILPVGTEKIGDFEYAVKLNNSPQDYSTLASLPIKFVNGTNVYIRDVATVHDGNAPQTNVVHVYGNRSVLLTVFKSGAISTLAIVDGIKAGV